MEVVLKNWLDDVLMDLHSNHSEGYVKQYRQAAERYLRIARLHGPYQAAMSLCVEVAGVKNVDNSPKLLLHDHIFNLLGYEEGWLVTAINEERDPMKCLELGSLMMLFLIRICDRLQK